MKKIFFILMMLGPFIFNACNGNSNGKTASDKVVSNNSTTSTTQSTNSLGIDLVGDWILTDWDSDIDEGHYDVGDILQFRSNGRFKGLKMLDTIGVGNWSTNGDQLTIEFDEIILKGKGSVKWTINSRLVAKITVIDEDHMKWSGRFHTEGTASDGDSAIETPKMEIELKRR